MRVLSRKLGGTCSFSIIQDLHEHRGQRMCGHGAISDRNAVEREQRPRSREHLRLDCSTHPKKPAGRDIAALRCSRMLGTGASRRESASNPPTVMHGAGNSGVARKDMRLINCMGLEEAQAMTRPLDVRRPSNPRVLCVSRQEEIPKYPEHIRVQDRLDPRKRQTTKVQAD